MKNTGDSGEYCERIDAPTPEEFFVNYVLKSKPVIIKEGINFMVTYLMVTPLGIKHWAAMSKWTNEFLSSTFKGNKVGIKVTPQGEFEGCEDASLWEGENDEIPDLVKSKLQR